MQDGFNDKPIAVDACLTVDWSKFQFLICICLYRVVVFSDKSQSLVLLDNTVMEPVFNFNWVFRWSELINPLECKDSCGATLNNMKLVHWPSMGGLLHLVKRGWHWAGCSPDRPSSLYPPINGQCTMMVRCCAVLIWWLKGWLKYWWIESMNWMTFCFRNSGCFPSAISTVSWWSAAGQDKAEIWLMTCVQLTYYFLPDVVFACTSVSTYCCFLMFVLSFILLCDAVYWV